VGVAYTSVEINFTIADGTTDFDEDDSFVIPITLGINVGDALYGADDGKASTTSSGSSIGNARESTIGSDGNERIAIDRI
jgi:hypothetical protein